MLFDFGDFNMLISTGVVYFSDWRQIGVIAVPKTNPTSGVILRHGVTKLYSLKVFDKDEQPISGRTFDALQFFYKSNEHAHISNLIFERSTKNQLSNTLPQRIQDLLKVFDKDEQPLILGELFVDHNLFIKVLNTYLI